jgi:hypothetical protein
VHYRHRLAERAARHAPVAARQVAALERTGVRATYRLHDRVLSNPRSRRRFLAHRPVLDVRQGRVVDQLRRDGFCAVPFSELFAPAHWAQLEADAAGWTDVVERRMADGVGPETLPSEKPFWRRHTDEPTTLTSPWLRLAASRHVLDIVNSYLGMWSKLTHADQWYSPALGPTSARVGAMRWHRDYNDRHIVKLFVYLDDVDDRAGPLEYVSGSTGNGAHADVWPWQPLSEVYPDQAEIARRIPPSATRTLTAPAGTLIFCDTSGFHRGGHVTERPRKLWVFHYVSPAALHALVDRNFVVQPADLNGFDPVQRFAMA